MDGHSQISQVRDVPLLISFFAHTSDAELALSDLVSEGLSEQDFTLVKFGEQESANHFDALENVIEPFGNRRIASLDQGEGATDRESQIGGGIETASPDDDVSAIEEMDDSESISEEILYPSKGRSVEADEAGDIEIGARTGFFRTTWQVATHSKRAEPMLTEMELAGFGLLIGEGSLGEILLEAHLNGGSDGAKKVIDLFAGPDKLPSCSCRCGAFLAVDIVITGPDDERVSDILLQRGAQFVDFIESEVL